MSATVDITADLDDDEEDRPRRGTVLDEDRDPGVIVVADGADAPAVVQVVVTDALVADPGAALLG